MFQKSNLFSIKVIDIETMLQYTKFVIEFLKRNLEVLGGDRL